MSESIFEKRSLADIYEEIRQVYLADNKPWIIGYSGGKDSTCMTQMVWNALSKLPPEKLHKNIYIISSDTLVESPPIIERIKNSLSKIEEAAKTSHLPISTNLLRPPLENTFWVRLLGRGYPAPTSQFRWCTDMLKINNADEFIKNKVSEYGEAIVLLGMRKTESSNRKQTMEMYKIENSRLSKHSRYAQTYIYTPLEEFEAKDVWNYLLENKNPWGEQNRDLLSLYQDANAKECPLVVDTSTESCGTGRFGCWTCTVVNENKALSNLESNGYEWMAPLAELREILHDTQDPENWSKVREAKRRHGRVELKQYKNDFLKNDKELDYTPGPYTLEFRKEFLEKLLQAQVEIQKDHDPTMKLISEDEIKEIQRFWRVEQGDWENSAFQIYEKITGEKIEYVQDDMGEFGQQEQELLYKICKDNQVPGLLLSKLLNAEKDVKGKTRRSNIFKKIKHIISEEWRDNLDEILDELVDQRKKQDELKFVPLSEEEPDDSK